MSDMSGLKRVQGFRKECGWAGKVEVRRKKNVWTRGMPEWRSAFIVSIDRHWKDPGDETQRDEKQLSPV